MTATIINLADVRAQRTKTLRCQGEGTRALKLWELGIDSGAEAEPEPSALEWRRLQKGNSEANVDGYHLVVFPSGFGSGWRFRIKNLETEYAFVSQCWQPSEDAAKTAALTAVRRLMERGC